MRYIPNIVEFIDEELGYKYDKDRKACITYTDLEQWCSCKNISKATGLAIFELWEIDESNPKSVAKASKIWSDGKPKDWLEILDAVIEYEEEEGDEEAVEEAKEDKQEILNEIKDLKDLKRKSKVK